ncbi:glycosyltransferase [Vibrio sp. NTOU-M3]|uniref:glycosyltransferase n=1 Tax=Vibrio sp. NTOU-M3 TaxID=3234954 RepID=UPI00349F878A
MRDLIVFGEDFGGLPSSTQHIVKYLAKERKVLWVNSIGLRQPRLCWKDAARAMSKLCGLGKGGYQLSTVAEKSDIHVVNLKTIPAPASTFSRQLAKSLMLSQLKPLVERYQLDAPLLWISLPTAADLCGHLGESAVVYYCGDDFSSLAGVDHHVVAQHEHRLTSQADLILGASEKICRKFPACKTHHLPHGVDLDLFSCAAPRASDLPNRGKPVAGFYGSLSEWLDYDMLEQVCTRRPDWDFVFIGPCELNQNKLPKRENVFYLGPKPHHELPCYSQHWDVSLLPFKDNPQIRACSPLKLMEYLAARTPIITTDFPALQPYKQYVNLISDSNDLCATLTTAQLQPKLPENIVSNASWESRSHFVNWLLELL